MIVAASASSRAVDLGGVAAPYRGSAGRARRVAGPSSMKTLRHLSTPPITGSIDATAAIASATMPPSHIAATA